MIPGEYRIKPGDIELNAGRRKLRLTVANLGDRPVQVGSHYHFYEVNRELRFDRESAFGMRLDIAAGTAERFEPGEMKPVNLVELGGARAAYGMNGLTEGDTLPGMTEELRRKLATWQAEGGGDA